MERRRDKEIVELSKPEALVLYENDDDLPILLEAKNKKEMMEKLYDFMVDGYDDCYIVTKSEYLIIKKLDEE